MFLVFLGFNLLSDTIPVHFIMTVLFSLFTGAILIGLGTINYKKNSDAEEERSKKSKMDELDSELKSLKEKLDQMESENSKMKDTLSDFEKIKSEYLDAESKIDKLKSELDNKAKLLSTYESQLSNLDEIREGYLRFHKGRIEKKLPENRTSEENELLEEFKKNNL
jgi:uncharacterized protein YlxW (UPF0749 family)